MKKLLVAVTLVSQFAFAKEVIYRDSKAAEMLMTLVNIGVPKVIEGGKSIEDGMRVIFTFNNISCFMKYGHSATVDNFGVPYFTCSGPFKLSGGEAQSMYQTFVEIVGDDGGAMGTDTMVIKKLTCEINTIDRSFIDRNECRIEL